MRLNHFGMYPEQAFQPIGKRMTLEGGGGKGGSAPPAPDYTGAAQATAQGNKEAAMAAKSFAFASFVKFCRAFFNSALTTSFHAASFSLFLMKRQFAFFISKTTISPPSSCNPANRCTSLKPKFWSYFIACSLLLFTIPISDSKPSCRNG